MASSLPVINPTGGLKALDTREALTQEAQITEAQWCKIYAEVMKQQHKITCTLWTSRAFHSTGDNQVYVGICLKSDTLPILIGDPHVSLFYNMTFDSMLSLNEFKVRARPYLVEPVWCEFIPCNSMRTYSVSVDCELYALATVLQSLMQPRPTDCIASDFHMSWAPRGSSCFTPGTTDSPEYYNFLQWLETERQQRAKESAEEDLGATNIDIPQACAVAANASA